MLIGEAGGKMKRRNRVGDPSFLPTDKAPVVVFMGSTFNARPPSSSSLRTSW